MKLPKKKMISKVLLLLLLFFQSSKNFRGSLFVDANTVKTAEKYEVRGVDEDVKTVPDIEKKLEEMEENGDELDLDDDDEEIEVPDLGLISLKKQSMSS